MKQIHLPYKATVNLGSYYTPKKYIQKCYDYLMSEIKNISSYHILDSSCGYGDFLDKTLLKHPKYIGSDVDLKALQRAKQQHKNVTYFHRNSLYKVNRKNYLLTDKEPLIIVGNPPYNDVTSLVNKNVKYNTIEIDDDITTRDLGMSFMLSYAKLKADYVCVLHPLSYLIKRSNFTRLRSFMHQYRLIDAMIFNSQEFHKTSRVTGFPVIIAFYKRDFYGMSYDAIKTYRFKTADQKTFSISDYDYIDHYITKYPCKNNPSQKDTVAYFWTMRDINALKRNKTFVDKEGYNTVHVNKNNMHYYCYVDVFKRFLDCVPYYFGNSNVLLNHDAYETLKNEMTQYSINTNAVLQKTYPVMPLSSKMLKKIENYFKDLLQEHYVY